MCTPDFFGFNGKDELQYRGRLDESKTTLVKNARRELYEAMKLVADTGHGPKDQIPSIKVDSGTWDFFTEEDFHGDSMRLAPGPYPQLTAEWNKHIGSFMCVR